MKNIYKLVLFALITLLFNTCMLPDGGGKTSEIRYTTSLKQRQALDGSMVDVIEYVGQADLDMSGIGTPQSTLLGATLEFTIAFATAPSKEDYFKTHTQDILVVASTQRLGGMSYEDYVKSLPANTLKGISDFGSIITITEAFLQTTLAQTNRHFHGQESTENGGSDPQLVRKQLESIGVYYNNVDFVAPYYPR